MMGTEAFTIGNHIVLGDPELSSPGRPIGCSRTRSLTPCSRVHSTTVGELRIPRQRRRSSPTCSKLDRMPYQTMPRSCAPLTRVSPQRSSRSSSCRFPTTSSSSSTSMTVTSWVAASRPSPPTSGRSVPGQWLRGATALCRESHAPGSRRKDPIARPRHALGGPLLPRWGGSRLGHRDSPPGRSPQGDRGRGRCRRVATPSLAARAFGADLDRPLTGRPSSDRGAPPSR